MASDLTNERIDELPDGVPKANDYFVFRDMQRGLTCRVPAQNVLPQSQDDNFEWSSTHTYDEDEVVTYSGIWWQSLVADNLGVVPGTGDTVWLAVPKASGFTWWQAGIYSEAKPIVMSDHRGQARWYRLSSAVRPYISSNITAEENAGDWDSISEMIETIELEQSPVMVLDVKYHGQVVYNILDIITGDAEFQITHGGKLSELTIACAFDTLGQLITFPAGTQMSDPSWDPGTFTWTVPIEAVTGRSLFKLIKDQTGFVLTVIYDIN